MTKALIAATALALLALSPLAVATGVQAQRQPKTHHIPDGQPEPQPTSTYSCSEKLGYLRRVHASELAQVTDWTKVWVNPICVDQDQMFRNAGNAGKLRAAIAANAAMQKALDAKAFGPDDVVGIRMTDVDKLILFVHPFHK